MFVNQPPFELWNMHLRSAERGKTEPKNGSEEFDLSRLCYLCIMNLRHPFGFLYRKGLKLFHICLALGIVFIIGCHTKGVNSETKFGQMTAMSDSLWSKHKGLTSQFRFKLDVIKERQVYMKSFLKNLKFVDGSKLTEAEKSDAIRYEAVYRVYKEISENYTHTVLTAEELFYEIKGLEKQLKNGVYGDGEDAKKLDVFKKEFSVMEKKLTETAESASFIDRQLTGVEPGFQTLQPKMEAIAARFAFAPEPTAEGRGETEEEERD